jgi:gliding motility-associated-like protein
MRQILLIILLILIPIFVFADGNQTLGNSYSLTTCGLNFTSASQRLGQRFSPPGVSQPAPFTISGIPANAVIEKAFLYADASGTAAAQVVTVQGPLQSQVYNMTIIGSGPDKCWNRPGSYSYRADVTSVVTGNGTYNISGFSTINPTDIDGATLLVIYADPTQTWEGTIIIDDGALVGNTQTGTNQTYTMNFAAPCGTPNSVQAFMAVGDIQYNNETIELNNTPAPYTFNWWNYFQVSTTMTAAQTTAAFHINSNGQDCFNFVFTGMYFHTNCCNCNQQPPPPIVISTSSTPTTCTQCDGTATATATGGNPPFSYSWSPNGGTAATATGLCPGIYTVTVADGCSSATATVSVVMGPGGFGATSTETSPECYGYCDGSATVTPVSGQAPYTYSWAPTGGNAATATNLCAGTYTVTVNDAQGCFINETVTVTEPPQVPVPIPGNIAYCQFSTAVPLTATPSAAGDVVHWYDQPTGGNFTLTGPTPVTNVAGTYIWYISEINALGCESERVPITALIKPKPLYPLVNSYTYCQYHSADVVHLYAQGDSLQWYTVPTGGIGTYVPPLPTVDTFGTAVWYVTQTVDGCESDRASQVVTINPGVLANFSFDLVLGCGRDTLNLTDSSTINGTESLAWNFGDGSPIETFQQNPMHIYYYTGTYPVLLTVSNGFCSDSISKDVYAFVQTNKPLEVGQGPTICLGDSVQLHAYGDSSYTYHWAPDWWITNENTANPTVKPELNFVYTATALDTIGCTHTGYVKVSIASNAILSIPDSVVLYPGDSYQLSPEGNCLYFTWFPATGLSADSIANPVAMPEVSTRYIVHGTTEYGCKVTDSIDVFIDPSTMLYLPNAFVPGNGTNGVFKIVKRGMATLNYFRIYDRWGVKVYDSKDIDAGWDGTYKGKPQPLGVYVYQIEAVTNTGQKFTKQGNVTLLR